DLRIGPVAHGGAGDVGGLALDQRAGHGVPIGLGPAVAAAVDLDLEHGRQRVDHGDADAVQTAGDGVAVGVELAARVQLGEHDLHGRLTGLVHLHRDAAAVVADLDRAVGPEGHMH